eukprot:28551-Prymnesium_polylepis.1
MGLPVDADTASSDAPPPNAGDECAQPCSADGSASDQYANDDFIDDAELVGVKVLPLTPSPSVFRGACGFAGAVLRCLCAGRA